jgi:hypothetical protein
MRRLGVVAYISNPSYLGGRGRRILVWGQPEQKYKTLSEKQTKKQKDRGHGSSGRAFA